MAVAKDLPKVHLNGQEVITLCMRAKKKWASVNGRRIPWAIAEKVFAECLKAGVLPNVDYK